MNFNNRKLHYKMYKAGKKWVISGIITTSFFMGIESISVNADNNSTNQSIEKTTESNSENVNSLSSSANNDSLNKNLTSSQPSSSLNDSKSSDANNSLSNTSTNSLSIDKSNEMNSSSSVSNINKSNDDSNISSSNQNASSSDIGNRMSSSNSLESSSSNNLSDTNQSSKLNLSENSLLSSTPSDFSYQTISNGSTVDPTTIDAHIKKVNNNYYYYNADGQIQKNILVSNNNSLAYFDSNGNYVDVSSQVPQTKIETVKNDFSVQNSLYSLDPSSITTTNGFLTANSWYRPKEILQNGTTWAQSNENDFRPLLMSWWPSKQVQINYLNYMNANNLGINNYSDNDSLDSLLQGAHAVQSKIEQKIVSNNGNTEWLKTLINNFINTQTIWNTSSEGLDNNYNSGGLQGGILRYNNSSLTPYANSDYRLLNREPGTQTGKPSYNLESYNGFEFLLANDVDNSNPVVQAETLNWLHYLMNFGSITSNDPSANFDSFRVDAVDDVDSDLLQIFSQYFKDAYGVDQNDSNANKHISILEGWSSNDSPYLRDHGQYQINMDNPWMIGMRNALSWSPSLRSTMGNIISAGLVNRKEDYNDNQVIPNYTYLRAHDTYVQELILQIIKDKIDPNASYSGNFTQSEIDQAFKYYNDDMNSTNKVYNLYNVPSSYALLLTNKDTVPRVYYGDLYTDDGQYMANKTIYNNTITSMLSARVKYVSGGQSMNTNNDGSILTSVRYGKGANSPSDLGDNITRQSGIAVVESNNPNLSDTQVNINMGAAHKNQAYRPLILPSDNGLQTFNNDDSAKNEIIYTDKNGVLTLNSNQVKGYSNPQLSGYLSMWVPVGASENQDVRTSPSTSDTNDGKSLHSNSALDSNVIFESFSNFQAIPQNTDQYQNAVLAKEAPMLKQLGFTSIELPPQYRSTTGNSFLDEGVQNGYAFSDRYDLGFGTPTKYGTVEQLRDALKAIHSQGMQAMADVVANQLYGLNTPEVVSATRVDKFGNPTGTSSIDNDLYYANSIGGGKYQQEYGGEFLEQLKQLYPDIFASNQISTGKPIDPSVQIKQWSAKYLNGSNIQGRGSDFVLRNAGNNQYYFVGDQGVSLPNQLTGNDVVTGFENNNGNVSYYTLNGQKVEGSLINIDGSYYSFDDNGDLIRNKLVTNNGSGIKYISLPNGKLLTNSFYNNNGKLYYFNDSGNLLKDQFLPSDSSWTHVYYLGDDGSPITGKHSIDNITHYFDSNGFQVKDSFIVNDDKTISYYTPQFGNLAVSSTIHSGENIYNFDQNGNLVAPNKFIKLPIDNNTTYYLDSNSKIIGSYSNLKGYQVINGNAYNFDDNGNVLYGNFNINGTSYHTDINGVLIKDSSSSNGSPSTYSPNSYQSPSSLANFISDFSTASSSSSVSSSSATSSSASSVSSAASSASSSVSSSSATSSASSSKPGNGAHKSNNGSIASAKAAMIKAQKAVKVAEKNKQQSHSKIHVKNYNKALDNYYNAEYSYLKTAKLYNRRYYYDFNKVTKHSKYVKVNKLAYVHNSKKFTDDTRVSKLKKGTKVKVKKIVRHGKTTRFNIGHNKFITGLKSFIHKLTK